MSQGSDQDEADKSYEPTQKKLDDARKKGDIPRSTDLNATAAFAGFFLALFALSAGYGEGLSNSLLTILEDVARHSDIFFSGSPQPFSSQLASGVFPGLTLLFVVPAASVILLLVATKSILFAPSKIAPKLNKISIKSNAANKFGRSGLFEFAKSFLKLVLFSVCLGVLIFNSLPDMVGSAGTEPAMVVIQLWEMLLQFLSLVVLVSASIGVIDFVFQTAEHRRKLMMSRKELMDESKESEGDPHLKSERRRRGQEAAMAQSVQDTAQADVVITNPTHFAVALKWSRSPGEAPVCVSKGQDHIAKKIREIAQQHAVPIHPDPPTARAIFASTEIGDEIAPELYQAVAVAIRFAESMRIRQRSAI